MKTNWYIVTSIALMLLVSASYILQFYFHLGFQLSEDTETWAQLGDFIGGILNPLLSFISIVLLIKSLTLQNEANIGLRKEIKSNEKTEKLRSFESLFFNLIDSQKKQFESFHIEKRIVAKTYKIYGVKAVVEIEDEIEKIRNKGGTDHDILVYLNDLDEFDQLFGVTRAFYVAVKVIDDRLSDTENFDKNDRLTHYNTLINFTDFSQLRLIFICIQFLDFESCKFIRSLDEFNEVITKLGLKYDLY